MLCHRNSKSASESVFSDELTICQLPRFVVGGYDLTYSSPCPSVPLTWLYLPTLANTTTNLFLPHLPLLVLQGGIVYHHCVLSLNMYLGNVLKKHTRNLIATSHRFFCGLLCNTGEPKSTLFFLIAFPQNKWRGVIPHGSFHSI